MRLVHGAAALIALGACEHLLGIDGPQPRADVADANGPMPPVEGEAPPEAAGDARIGDGGGDDDGPAPDAASDGAAPREAGSDGRANDPCILCPPGTTSCENGQCVMPGKTCTATGALCDMVSAPCCDGVCEGTGLLYSACCIQSGSCVVDQDCCGFVMGGKRCLSGQCK
jgi:hypothetical protein